MRDHPVIIGRIPTLVPAVGLVLLCNATGCDGSAQYGGGSVALRILDADSSEVLYERQLPGVNEEELDSVSSGGFSCTAPDNSTFVTVMHSIHYETVYFDACFDVDTAADPFFLSCRDDLFAGTFFVYIREQGLYSQGEHSLEDAVSKGLHIRFSDMYDHSTGGDEFTAEFDYGDMMMNVTSETEGSLTVQDAFWVCDGVADESLRTRIQIEWRFDEDIQRRLDDGPETP